jgi:S1-C subfamily serine protease
MMVAALTALTLSSLAWADEKVYQQTLPSTVLVISQTRDGGATGSGVLVDGQRKWVLTNFHVVHDSRQLAVVFPTYDGDGQLIAERSAYIDRAGELRRRGRVVDGRVIAREPRLDLALIELEQLPEDAKAVRLAGASPRPGQRVHSIGNPGASDGLWLYSQGHVRAVYRRSFVVEGDLEVRARVVETQSPINRGDSGGPVVNDRGELVALVESVNRGRPGEEVRLLSTFIDVTEIKSFLMRHTEAADRANSSRTTGK